MAFQTVINYALSAGNVGEQASSAEKIVHDFRLDSQTTSPNRVGFAFTYAADEVVQNGNTGSKVATVGGTGAFAGILVAPKNYASYGVAGNTLGATIDVPANTMVQLARSGEFHVQFTTAVAYGDQVYYSIDTSNGDLKGGLYNAPAANRVLIPNAIIISSTDAPSASNPCYAVVRLV